MSTRDTSLLLSRAAKAIRNSSSEVCVGAPLGGTETCVLTTVHGQRFVVCRVVWGQLRGSKSDMEAYRGVLVRLSESVNDSGLAVALRGLAVSARA